MKKFFTYLQVVVIGLGILCFQSCNTVTKERTETHNENRDQAKQIAYHEFIGMIEDDSVFIESNTEEDGYFLYPKVTIADDVLFYDSSSVFYDLQKKILAIDFGATKYFIITTANPPDNDEFLILTVREKKISETHKAPVGYLADVDGDGIKEIGGFKLIEAYCISCDSAYYNPPIIYELGDSVRHDPEAIKMICQDLYGVYLGLERRDTVLRVK